jgi:hypothetical protein
MSYTLSEFIERDVELGYYDIISYRKVHNQSTFSSRWFDLSVAPGNPVPEFYASTPLTATPINHKTSFRIRDADEDTRYITKVILTTSSSQILQVKLINRIAFWPFVDGDDPSLQVFNNDFKAELDNYPNTQVYLVAQSAISGNVKATINYTDRLSNTYSSSQQINDGSQYGQLCFGSISGGVESNGPFLNLNGNDKFGPAFLESVQFSSGLPGGILCFVLCQVLADFELQTSNSPVEVDFIKDQARLIKLPKGAQPSFLVHATGSLSSAVITGTIESWFT